tara:strand:- start:233 stop:778 length:546 start_codon:yes stop_codon:yes gene_type:complete
MGFLFWGEKNQFKKKFNQIKLKDLQKELTEKEVEQDVLTNEIQRWSSEYDGWFRKGSDPNATDTDLQICASRMEICESNKSRIESELQETVNEVSIIQAAIGIKEQETKGNKSSILNTILNSEGTELQTYLTEIAVATKNGNTKMETALDLLTKPQVGGSPIRSESFNRNIDKLKKARGDS